MPPKFTLQSVLDYRHTRVEVLEVNLGRLMQARQAAFEELAWLDAGLNRLYSELASLQKGEIDLQSIAQVRGSIRRTQKLITSQEDLLHQLDGQIEEARRELVQARQDESVMENLSEKELERFYVKVNASEKRLQDDINIAKAFSAHSNLDNRKGANDV